jgi:phosphomannomutase
MARPPASQPMNWPQSGLIATHSGLRGRPGVGLTSGVIERALRGFLELCRLRGLPSNLAVARDERPEGEGLSRQVIEIAREEGADVVDLGVVSTPAAKLAARSRGLGGAVVVTGSHLAPELNGLKLIAGPAYLPVDVRRLRDPGQRGAAHRRGKLWREQGVAAAHVAAVCASLDAELIRRAGLRAGCEGGPGPGASLLLETLGCLAPGSPPDLVLRLDADGDRLALVDEGGTLLDADVTLALCVEALDAKAVVKGADTSRMVDELAAARGGKVRVVPPGEVHLLEALIGGGGDLAGEGNGGVVVPAVGLARDALAAAGSILSLLARSGMPLSALATRLPRYARRRSTVAYSDPDAPASALAALAQRIGVEVPENLDGGIHIEGDSAWGLVRPSATEPVLRVTAEARTDREADALHATLREGLLDGALSS